MSDEDQPVIDAEMDAALQGVEDYYGPEGRECIEAVTKKILGSVRATPEPTAEPPAAPPEPEAPPAPELPAEFARDDDAARPYLSWEALNTPIGTNKPAKVPPGSAAEDKWLAEHDIRTG